MIGLLVASVGCGHRAKVLKPEKMKEIYVDMFVADGWLRERQDLRIKADTSLFFDPIFEKHNCTHEEFFVSWEYYTAHPDEYSDLMMEVVDEIQKRSDIVAELLKQYEEAMAVYASLPDYASVDFKADSMKSLGSIAFWKPVIDSLSTVVDSLATLDSLEQTDSIEQAEGFVEIDSLVLSVPSKTFFDAHIVPAEGKEIIKKKINNSQTEKLDIIVK